MGTTARRRSRPPVWPNCSGSTCWICFRTCPTWRPLPTNPDRGHRRVRVRATANPDPIGNLDFFSFFLFFFLQAPPLSLQAPPPPRPLPFRQRQSFFLRLSHPFLFGIFLLLQ